MVYEMHFVASYGRKLLHESSDETNPAAGGAAAAACLMSARCCISKNLCIKYHGKYGHGQAESCSQQ